MIPERSLIDRFRADLDALIPTDGRMGVAVSGGPDSLALLLLAAAAKPGSVEAATVDHGLRPEAAEEARSVAAICADLEVPHTVLDVTVGAGASMQARAREARYQALAEWAAAREIDAIATAHHLDDQAETVLMRAARGAGVGGLAGILSVRVLPCSTVTLIRPLLGWRRSELAAVVAGAGLTPVEDPSNADERFDRTHARALLADIDWLDPERLAQVGANAADADDALDWATARIFDERAKRQGVTMTIDPAGLPRELRRRLLIAAFTALGIREPGGPELVRAIKALERAETVTLAGLKLEGGATWKLSPAPPRRR